jgi:hypothetical protein
LKGAALQLRLPVSVAIFIGSYLPLAAILLVQDVNYALIGNGYCWRVWSKDASCVLPLAHPFFSLGIFGICLASFCVTLFTLSVADPKLSIEVKESKYIPAELLSYTLPYVVAFMSIGYQETGKFIGLLIFLAWMFWITHKSGQVLVNPLLVVLGWRLYEIKYSFPNDNVLYSGRALAKGMIEPEHSYPHTVIQDIVVLRPTLPTDEE